MPLKKKMQSLASCHSCLGESTIGFAPPPPEGNWQDQTGEKMRKEPARSREFMNS